MGRVLISAFWSWAAQPGSFLKYLRQKRACSVVGVEVDPVAAAEARKFCNEVLSCDLNSPEWIEGLPTQGFDVILMGDVLEHLIEPQAVLEQLQPLLALNASIIISLRILSTGEPGSRYLFGRFEYESFGILDHTHLRFYTPKTARKMIESAGYEIMTVSSGVWWAAEQLCPSSLAAACQLVSRIFRRTAVV